MITENELLRFQNLRRRLFDAIKRAIEDDPHHKSYEGAFAISMLFNNMFETSDRECAELGPEEYEIRLDCYVIGPRRHYEWGGYPFESVLDRCETDIDEWIQDYGKEDDWAQDDEEEYE